MAVLRWLDANVEKIFILVCYVTMAGIIFVEVFRRFVFNEQVPWSTTVPVYLFLWIVWLGCAYNVKIRAHLRFDELRLRQRRRCLPLQPRVRTQRRARRRRAAPALLRRHAPIA